MLSGFVSIWRDLSLCAGDEYDSLEWSTEQKSGLPEQVSGFLAGNSIVFVPYFVQPPRGVVGVM